MLGSYVSAQAAAAGFEVFATYSAHEVEIPGCRMVKLDIGDREETARVVGEIGPGAIIHTAALVKPDVCEQQKDVAYRCNVAGTSNIIAAAESVGAHLVHVSTDLVFSGEHSPSMPDDTLSPVNYYGLTKACAEAAVYASKIDWAVVRTSIIYGQRMFPNLVSFSDSVIDSLRSGQEVRAFVDQYRSPIPAWNLADVLIEIAQRQLTGIYHAVCPETSTRYQFARKVAQIFGLDETLIKPISMDEVPSPARRPKMLVIDTKETQGKLNVRLLGFEEGIGELRDRV